MIIYVESNIIESCLKQTNKTFSFYMRQIGLLFFSSFARFGDKDSQWYNDCTNSKISHVSFSRPILQRKLQADLVNYS